MDWGSDFSVTMVVSVVTGLVLLLVFTVLPKARGERMRQPPQPEPRRAPNDPDQDADTVALPPPVTEQQILNAKQAHDDLLAEAMAFWRQARGHHHESVFLMERALAKIDDAHDVRPDSFDAVKLSADLQLDLAQEVPEEDSRTHLEASIAAYDTAISYRFGNVDCHVGLGWARMLLAQETGDPADYAAAVAVFERAAEASPRNLHILRGWAAALDGFIRVAPDGGDEAVARYRRVVADHPVAGRDLDNELYDRRRTETWIIPPVPPLRDV